MHTISNLLGEPDNMYEKCSNSKLEDEIDKLQKQIDGAKQALQHLDIQCEAVQTELNAQIQVENSIDTSLRIDVEAFRKKSEILSTYIAYIKSNDFEIHKLRQELSANCHQTRSDLMQFVQKKNELVKRWQHLNDLARECAPIKDQVERFHNTDTIKSK